jgi:hypothetical protein
MPVTYDLTTGGQLPTPATPVPVASGGPAPTLQPLIQFKVTLPDTYPGNVTFAGRVSPVSGSALGASVAMTGLPIALPAVPGSGTVFWALQVNLATGAVTMKTSTVAAPTADTGNLVIMSHKVVNGDTVPWSAGVAAATTLGTAPTFPDLC